MTARLITALFVAALAVTASAQAPTKAASSIDPCLASPDVLGVEPFVMATLPRAGARVKNGFVVKGCSRTFESSFAWTLSLRGGTTLATGTGRGGGVDGPGPFSFTVAAAVTTPTLVYLELYEPRMSDEGPAPMRVIVPVVLLP